MGKREALDAFETDLTNPGSLKSGEFLEDRIRERAARLIPGDRAGVVDAFRDWIARRSEPFTMLAVDVARMESLTELEPEVEGLQRDIAAGLCFRPHYVRRVDAALVVLRGRGTRP